MARRRSGSITFGIVSNPTLQELGRKMEAIGKGFADFKPIWAKLSKVVDKEVDRIWSTQGGALGKKWRPLSERYRQRKINDPKLARSGGGKIMQRSGDLRRSLKTISKTKNAMRYGVKKLPYARAMNFQLGKARPYLGVTDKMREAFIEEANRYIAKQLKAAGL